VLVLGSFKLWQRSKIDSNYKYFICFILNQKYKQEDKSNVKNVFLNMIKLLYKGKELLFDPKFERANLASSHGLKVQTKNNNGLLIVIVIVGP